MGRKKSVVRRFIFRIFMSFHVDGCFCHRHDYFCHNLHPLPWQCMCIYNRFKLYFQLISSENRLCVSFLFVSSNCWPILQACLLRFNLNTMQEAWDTAYTQNLMKVMMVMMKIRKFAFYAGNELATAAHSICVVQHSFFFSCIVIFKSLFFVYHGALNMCECECVRACMVKVSHIPIIKIDQICYTHRQQHSSWFARILTLCCCTNSRCYSTLGTITYVYQNARSTFFSTEQKKRNSCQRSC